MFKQYFPRVQTINMDRLSPAVKVYIAMIIRALDARWSSDHPALAAPRPLFCTVGICGPPKCLYQPQTDQCFEGERVAMQGGRGERLSNYGLRGVLLCGDIISLL